MTKEKRIEAFDSLISEHISSYCYQWLVDNGFFTAPASVKFHRNYEGGLFDHSYAVTKTLLKLTKDNKLTWENNRSPYIVGMFHDLCKIDAYVPLYSSGFGYNNKILLNGHGEKSIILLQKFMDLAEEEMLCIRWHMGAYDNKDNWDILGRAIEKYQNVLWTHTADMVAARVLKV